MILSFEPQMVHETLHRRCLQLDRQMNFFRWFISQGISKDPETNNTTKTYQQKEIFVESGSLGVSCSQC
jgi:hypothetical protein